MAYWYDLHWQGGMEFMAPLSFLFAISILIFLFLLISTIVRKRTYAAWMERLKKGLSAGVAFDGPPVLFEDGG